MFKQEFDLRTGASVDDPEVAVPVLSIPAPAKGIGI
jgi:nitrite reductase (NADH) large subunit